jgi:hypothetical protein
MKTKEPSPWTVLVMSWWSGVFCHAAGGPLFRGDHLALPYINWGGLAWAVVFFGIAVYYAIQIKLSWHNATTKVRDCVGKMEKLKNDIGN